MVSEGPAALLSTDIHSIHLWGVGQCQDIGTLLMHSGKVHSRNIDKGKVAGKNDVFGLYGSVGGGQQIALCVLNRCVLINGQPIGDGFEEFQRMKLRLVFKFYSPYSLSRDLLICDKGGGKAQTGGRLRLLPEAVGRHFRRHRRCELQNHSRCAWPL